MSWARHFFHFISWSPGSNTRDETVQNTWWGVTNSDFELYQVKKAKIKVNVAKDWRCHPEPGKKLSLNHEFGKFYTAISLECPKTRRDCSKYDFVDDMFGKISRRDCVKWLRKYFIPKFSRFTGVFCKYTDIFRQFYCCSQ